jgi:hypothetical protein
MVMNNKILSIGAVLAVTLIAGVFATTPLAFADESETNTEQRLGQSNVGSGESTNFNCAENDIDGESFIDAQACGTLDLSEELEVIRGLATAAEE